MLRYVHRCGETQTKCTAVCREKRRGPPFSVTDSPFSSLKIRLFAGIGVDLVQTLDDPAGGPGKIGMFQPDEYGRKVEAGCDEMRRPMMLLVSARKR